MGRRRMHFPELGDLPALLARQAEKTGRAPAQDAPARAASAAPAPRRRAAQGITLPMGGNAATGALGRLPAGQMNKTEEAYARHLMARQVAGDVLWWAFEGITLRLGNRASYTPDFVVQLADRSVELHEVKGARAIFRDDARAKTRISASRFPFRILAVYPTDSACAAWEIEDFRP